MLQVLPPDVQRSAFRLFDCVGRGSLDFRNFCRALALCCRGSREERLRFLFDLFSAASQPKHYGTGTDGGVREAPGAPAACVSEVSKETKQSQHRSRFGMRIYFVLVGVQSVFLPSTMSRP